MLTVRVARSVPRALMSDTPLAAAGAGVPRGSWCNYAGERAVVGGRVGGAAKATSGGTRGHEIERPGLLSGSPGIVALRSVSTSLSVCSVWLLPSERLSAGQIGSPAAEAPPPRHRSVGTVTAQGRSPWTGHARSGDFYPAKNGDLNVATSGDFSWPRTPAPERPRRHRHRVDDLTRRNDRPASRAPKRDPAEPGESAFAQCSTPRHTTGTARARMPESAYLEINPSR